MRKVTKNERVSPGINWVWYHYPTKEEALEGLKKRSPQDYLKEVEKTWTQGCQKYFYEKEEALSFIRKIENDEDYKDVYMHYFGPEYIKEHWPTGYNDFGVLVEPEYVVYFSNASAGWCISHFEASKDYPESWGYRLPK